MRRVIVVGAGVIGLCCAYELCRRGTAVTVLDKQEPGAGCSSGNSGWIVPSLSTPLPAPGLLKTALSWLTKRDSPIRIQPRLDRGLASWLLEFQRCCSERKHLAGVSALRQLNRKTFTLYDALRTDGIEFETHRTGLLFVFKTPAALNKTREEIIAMAARCGYEPPRLLAAEEMREFEPGLSRGICGGLFIGEERHVRPESLTASLAARLRALGVSIHSGSAVTTIRAQGARVDAMTADKQIFEGDQLLIAAGVWSGRLGGQIGSPLPIQAGVGYSFTVPQPAVGVRHALYLFETKLACSPFHGALRIAGGMDLRAIDAAVDRSRFVSLWRAAADYLDLGHEPQNGTAWMGMRPLLPDGLPVIGPSKWCDNIYFATGHGMLGITLAPATASAIADAMCFGLMDPDLATFSPARFGRPRDHVA